MPNDRPRREIAQPTNDIAFKKLFGNPNDTFILLDFLNAVLEREYKITVEQITSFQAVNLPNGIEDKLSAFDVCCTDKQGRVFIVEMQVLGTGWSKERAQWYVAQAYYNQVKKAKLYTEAMPVYLIAVLGFNMFPQHDRYISCYAFCDTEDSSERLDGLNITFIELRKFKKQEVEKLSDKVALWCTFFKNYSDDEIIEKLCRKSKAIEKATKVLETYNWTTEEYAIYQKLLLIACDQANVAEFAKKNNEEWIKNAQREMEESKKTIEMQAKELEVTKNQVLQAKFEAEQKVKLAEEKAKLEAEQKVKFAENKTKLELAKRLLKTGMSVQEVAAVTNLTEKEVESIVNNH